MKLTIIVLLAVALLIVLAVSGCIENPSGSIAQDVQAYMNNSSVFDMIAGFISGVTNDIDETKTRLGNNSGDGLLPISTL